MKTYYININDLDKLDAQIIDERTLEDAERFKNYLNADDFTYLCEAENMEQAHEAWAKEWNESVFDRIAERHHP